MKGRIEIGCASLADKSFVASGWYPKECNTPEDRLRYYASRFRVVEVDSSYYAMPSKRNASLGQERTPDDFIFNVKAFRILTGRWTPADTRPPDIRQALPTAMQQSGRLFYRNMPEELRAEIWSRYKDAIAPLHEASKLGTVLFQFPATIAPHEKVIAHIEERQQRLEPYKLAVEFRNGTWFTEGNKKATFDFLRSRNLSFVAVDEPQGFESSVPPVFEVTGAFAIIRFHGRNTDTWERKGLTSSAPRFNY